MNFAIELFESVVVTDDENKIGLYKVKGRHWSINGGVTYELQPYEGTAMQFYRLFIIESDIKKHGNIWRAFVKGCQKKRYYSKSL